MPNRCPNCRWRKEDEAHFSCFATNSLGKADGRIQTYSEFTNYFFCTVQSSLNVSSSPAFASSSVESEEDEEEDYDEQQQEADYYDGEDERKKAVRGRHFFSALQKKLGCYCCARK